MFSRVVGKLKKVMKKPITIGSIISALILALCIFLDYNFDSLLDLNSQWIVLSSIPLIIALFIGDHISYFKGFGFEVKSEVSRPISNYVYEMGRENIISVPREHKRNAQYINSLPEEGLKEVRRLTFVEGREEYYGEEAISIYLSRLPNLQFFEIVNNNGRFVCLIPSDIFKVGDEVNRENINIFIQSVEERNVLEAYREVAISRAVRSDQSLLDVLPEARESKFNIVPVLNDNGELIGIITKEKIEKLISDAVLSFVS